MSPDTVLTTVISKSHVATAIVSSIAVKLLGLLRFAPPHRRNFLLPVISNNFSFTINQSVILDRKSELILVLIVFLALNRAYLFPRNNVIVQSVQQEDYNCYVTDTGR